MLTVKAKGASSHRLQRQIAAHCRIEEACFIKATSGQEAHQRNKIEQCLSRKAEPVSFGVWLVTLAERNVSSFIIIRVSIGLCHRGDALRIVRAALRMPIC